MFKKKSGYPPKVDEGKGTREVVLRVTGCNSAEGRVRKNALGVVWTEAFEALKKAHEDGVSSLVIRHGGAPSKRGMVTAGSQIRNLMRSHAASPYIFRSSCVQYQSAFVVAVRPQQDQEKKIAC